MNLPISDEMKERLLSMCPPASQNNERRYWKRKIDVWNRSKIETVGEEIADRFGLAFDYKSGSDYGNEPR